MISCGCRVVVFVDGSPRERTIRFNVAPCLAMDMPRGDGFLSHPRNTQKSQKKQVDSRFVLSIHIRRGSTTSAEAARHPVNSAGDRNLFAGRSTSSNGVSSLPLPDRMIPACDRPTSSHGKFIPHRDKMDSYGDRSQSYGDKSQSSDDRMISHDDRSQSYGGTMKSPRSKMIPTLRRTKTDPRRMKWC